MVSGHGPGHAHPDRRRYGGREQPHHYGDVAAVDGTYVAAWTAAGLNYLGPEWCADRSEEIDAAMTEWSR